MKPLISAVALLAAMFSVNPVDAATNDVAKLIAEGQAAMADKKLDRGRELLLAALKIDPESVQACLNLGRICEVEGHGEQAISWYEKAEPFAGEQRLAVKMMQRRAWKFQHVMETAMRILGYDDDSLFSVARRAKIQYGCGELEKAVQLYGEALRLKPGTPEFLRGRAEAFKARREFARAMVDYDACLKGRPTDADAIVGRLETLVLEKRHDVAIQDASRAIDARKAAGNADAARIVMARARAREAKGQAAEALSDAKTAHRLDPSALGPVEMAVRLAVDSKQPDQADDLVGAAVKLHPASMALPCAIADRLYRKGEFSQAAERYRAIIGGSSGVQASYACFRLATALARLKDDRLKSEIDQWIQKGNSMAMASPELYTAGGDAYLAQHRFEEAGMCYYWATSQDPDYTPAISRSGMVSDCVGDARAAADADVRERCLAPLPSPDLFRDAQEKFAKQDYPAAIEAFSRGLAIEPRNVLLLYLRAHSYLNDHRPKEAAADLEAIGEVAPTARFVKLALAHARQQAGDLDGAVRVLADYTQDFPFDRKAWLKLAEVQIQRRNPTSSDLVTARAVLEHCLSIRPDDLRGLSLRAELRRLTNEPDVAIEAAKQAPEPPETYETAMSKMQRDVNAYIVQKDKNLIDVALESAWRAHQLKPTEGKALRMMGWLSEMKADYESAYNFYVVAHINDPSQAEADVNRIKEMFDRPLENRETEKERKWRETKEMWAQSEREYKEREARNSKPSFLEQVVAAMGQVSRPGNSSWDRMVEANQAATSELQRRMNVEADRNAHVHEIERRFGYYSKSAQWERERR